MARKKTWDDDDGRTIAPMDDVSRPNLFFPGKRPSHTDPAKPQSEEGEEKNRPWEKNETFTRRERRWYALGALRAALLIGLAFIVGLGLTILLMVLLWG